MVWVLASFESSTPTQESDTAVQFASILAKDCLDDGFSRRLPSEMAFTIGIPLTLQPKVLSSMTASTSGGAGAAPGNDSGASSTAATFTLMCLSCVLM